MIGANDCLFIIAYSYLETGGADTFIRPWFWISWLLLGPIARSVCLQWYIFIVTRTLVRTEGLLTQLVFEHSLRIRLRAEGSNEKNEDSVAAIGTPDSASVAEDTAIENNSDERASQASRASMTKSGHSLSNSPSTSKSRVMRKDKDHSSTSKSDTKSTKDKQNLIGRINNLVTTDLGNIVEGRDFLLIGALQSLRSR